MSLFGLIRGFRSSDNTAQPLRLDRATNTLQIIDYAHHEMHSGSHFFLSGHIDLAINHVLDFTMVTPNTTKWAHWLWKIDTKSEANWFVYENAVITNPLANSLTPFNNNRNSATASGLTFKYEDQANLAAANADTDVTTATVLESGISGAGKGAGFDSRVNEIILGQNKIYCLRAIATAAGYIDFFMSWYEHTDIA